MMTLDNRLSALSRRSLTCAAILALTGLNACSSSGSAAHPKAQSAAERAKSTPILLDDYAKLGYRLDWRGFPTMLPGEHITNFEVLGDVVVAQESAGVVSILEARSGTTRWSEQVAGRLTKFVGMLRVGEQLVVSSESELFFYDIATGGLKNKQKLQQVVNTKPAQVGDILVYGCANGQVLGHLLTNGFRAWATGLGGSIEGDPIVTSAGRVAIASTTGEFVIVDPMSGLSQGRNKMFSGPGASFGMSDSAIYIASNDHSLYAFTSEAAQPVWRKRTDAPLHHKPVFNAGRVYCDLGTGDGSGTFGGLTCLDAVTGKILWSNPKVSGTLIGIRNKRLVVWDKNGKDGGTATTLKADDGTTIDSVALPGVTMLKADNFTDGNLYAISSTGLVAKLAPK